MLTALAFLARPVVVVGFVAAIATAAAGWQTVRLSATKVDLANIKAAQHEAARLAEAKARTDEARWRDQVDGVAKDARTKIAAARADAGLAVDATDRLRDRADAIAAIGCEGPVIAGGGQPASAPGPVLADMLRRVAQAAGQLAATADERGAAGDACQRTYEAVTKQK